MRKGSITPFSAVSLILVASLVLALLETARVYGLDRYAEMKTNAAMDSVCAEYQPYLWSQYGLLFLDGAYGSEEFSMAYVMEQLEHYMGQSGMREDWLVNWLGIDLFRLKKEEVLLEGYALAADDGGTLFLNYIAERAKEKLPFAIAEDLLAGYQRGTELEAEYEGMGTSVTKAQEAITQAKSEWIARKEDALEKKDGSGKDESEIEEIVQQPDTSVLDHLFDSIQQLRSENTLQMLVGSLADESFASYRLNETMQMRQKPEGTMYLNMEKSWYQKMLVLTYLESYFSNYVNQKEEHLLCYEMEYVLCGKDTEAENLAATLDRMLLLREAANAIHICADVKKMAEIEEIASVAGALAGGNYAITKVVEIGIVGAWAYAESVLDVRALVHGEQIPLIKNESDWTLALSEILCVNDMAVRAKKCADGMSYTDYLKQLLFFTENQKLAYRMMEAMELGMQSHEEYNACRMDYMIVMLRFNLKWNALPVFSELAMVGEVYRGKYIFSKSIERSYVP